MDKGEGPGPFFAKIAERFRPQAIYGDPTRRHIFIVVDLRGPAEIAELCGRAHPKLAPLTLSRGKGLNPRPTLG